jgi:hypothetical protein
MPDITKCQNNSCPIREKCYRYKSRPSELQSYASFKYELGGCDYFWPIPAEMRETQRVGSSTD